jgi:hypothetical protein
LGWGLQLFRGGDPIDRVEPDSDFDRDGITHTFGYIRSNKHASTDEHAGYDKYACSNGHPDASEYIDRYATT